jgi:hypothetical protein
MVDGICDLEKKINQKTIWILWNCKITLKVLKTLRVIFVSLKKHSFVLLIKYLYIRPNFYMT